MFSSDKNIESIAQLVESVKHYIGLKTEFMRFDLVDKVVKIITALVLTAVILIMVVLMSIYLSFALAFALGSLMDSYTLGFLIVAAIYLLLLLLVVAKRKTWIERPLVRFLVGILIEK